MGHNFNGELENYIQEDDKNRMNNFIESNRISLGKQVEISIGTTRKYKAYLISYAAFYKSQECFNSLLARIKSSDLDQKEILTQARLFAVMGGNIDSFKALQREEEMAIQSEWIAAALSFRQFNFLKYFLGEEEEITIEIDEDEDFLCSIMALYSIRMDSEGFDLISAIVKESNIKKKESIIKCGQLEFIKFLLISSPIKNTTYQMYKSNYAVNLDILTFFLERAINEPRSYDIVWNAIFKEDYDMAIDNLPQYDDCNTKMLLCLFMIKRFITSRDYNRLDNLRKKIGDIYFKRCMCYKISFEPYDATFDPKFNYTLAYSFLNLAVLSRDIRIVKLIAKHSYILEELPTGENAFYYATHLKSDDCLKRLLKLSGRFDKNKFPCNPKFHPVIAAIKENKPHSLRMLLKKGYPLSDTITPNFSSMGFLLYRENGKKECLTELLTFGKWPDLDYFYRGLLYKCQSALDDLESKAFSDQNFSLDDELIKYLKDDLDKLKLCNVSKKRVFEFVDDSLALFVARYRKWIVFDYLVRKGYARLLTREEVNKMIIYCLEDPQGIEILHKHHFFDFQDAAFFENLKNTAKKHQSPLPINRIEEIKKEVFDRRK